MEEETNEENTSITSSAQNARKRSAAPDDTVNQNIVPEKVAKATEKSDVHTVYCPICQENITTETIGKPDCCEHEFCLICLLEWSKNKNTCPVDRERFRKIFFKNASSNLYEGHCTVRDIPEEEEDPYGHLCRVCVLDLNDLVEHCYFCNRGVHQACIGPNQRDVRFGYRCHECIVRCGYWDIVTEIAQAVAQREALNAAGEGEVILNDAGGEAEWNARIEELDPEVREGFEAYARAVGRYLWTADLRFVFKKLLVALGRHVNSVGNLIEALENLTPYEDQVNNLIDFMDFSNRHDKNNLNLLQATDKFLSESELEDLNHEELDDYITRAQNALMAVAEDEQSDDEESDDAEFNMDEYIVSFVKLLEDELKLTGNDDE